jgi:hypothetical protein
VVVQTILVFVDGIGSRRIFLLENLPGPCPREIRKIILLLNMSFAIYCREDSKY